MPCTCGACSAGGKTSLCWRSPRILPICDASSSSTPTASPLPSPPSVGRPRGKAFRVYLDYAIPSYRDFKGGRWLYEERADFFHRFDVSEIVATGLTERQRRYLRRAGFRQREDGKWIRPI